MIAMNIYGNNDYFIPAAGIRGGLVRPFFKGRLGLRGNAVYKIRWCSVLTTFSKAVLPVVYSEHLPGKKFLLIPEGFAFRSSSEYEAVVVANDGNNSGVARLGWDKLIRFLEMVDIDSICVRVLNDESRVGADIRVNPGLLSLSQRGRRFIKDWEGFRANAYNDSEGYCTIGYGHLIARASCESIRLPLEFSKGVSRQYANVLFESRIPEMEKGVRDAVTADLFQHEFDALVSLVFNTGRYFLVKRGAPKLLAKLNSGDYRGASHGFSDITNGGTPGLVLRRKAEIDVFLIGVYNSDH
ncbi:lysozyme [Pseudomonas sp. PDM16]|uniref:lysozyme n=1 Tax=Pseudomonas sp. PDM16 TaxID=2769292 RepID=UPI00177A9A85|nr:lysozyme [Pseudomonas sp. PDM16]MBD9414222.1 lysozyme [Pseudomonas sp. PDM16]